MKKADKKLTKARIIAIVSTSVVALACVAVLIVNIFIPVKYFSAYVTPSTEREAGVLTVSYIDLDYGDCTIIELPDGKVMVIDAGDGSYPHMLRVMERLNSRGIDGIDYLVCSSVKYEHCGGLTEILKYKTVKTVYMPYIKNSYITESYRAFSQAVIKSGVHTEYSCFGTGAVNEEAGYFFTFISPGYYTSPDGEYANLNKSATTENIHNASAVLWLQYGQTSFVFSSDAGKDALKNIVEDYKICNLANQAYCPIGDYSVDLTACNVVTVAAHGYEDCTYAEWYDCLNADLAVLSVGKNYADSPSAQALADIANSSSLIRTDEQGTITITVNKDGYTVN